VQLSNNTILLTGGTSGIGLELLRQLYERNNQMLVTSRNETHLTKVQKEFPRITTLVCDLSDSNSVSQFIDKCLIRHRNVNVLINNAGIQYNYSWIDEKDGFKKISTEIRVNFTSPMQIAYGVLPILLQQESAAIVNISSGLALAPKKSAPIYCATKSAMHNATKALRYQLENTSVRVFEIIPPPVDTAMNEGDKKGKISPQQVVNEFLRNLQSNKLESNIGKIKWFRLIQRLSPALADHMKKNDL